MKIVYLGTGAAEGVPALFCNCEACRRARETREVRSRSQLLIGGDLSVDFPPDAFYHAACLGADLSAVKYLLVTHSHMDHFYAHDLILRGYKYAREMSSPTLEIFGNAEVGEVYAECTRREMRPEIAATISFRTVRAFERFSFGGYTVHALAAQHSSREPLLYLIEKGDKRILHLTDTGPLPEETVSYLAAWGKRCDLVDLDCTFLFGTTERSARHMGLDEDVRTLGRLERAGVVGEGTKKVLTHFSHNAFPTGENMRRAEELGFLAAYDGMELEI